MGFTPNTRNTHTRQQAASGNVEYGNTVVLHESNMTRVDLVPFYIPHSDHTGLKLKIVTYRKAQPPKSWMDVEEKSVTLSEDAVSVLLAELPKLHAMANEADVGEYLTIRVEDGIAALEDLDPEAVTSAILNVLSQKEIVSHLSGRRLDAELVKALQYSVRLSEMESAMADLRQMLDGGVALEREYQAWCEQHPWAFGNQFVVTDEVRSISTQDQVDMLMPRIAAGYRDIVELKRPDREVLLYDVTHRDYFFTRDVSMAIGQCHRYLDVFTEVASKGLLGYEQIVAYHPEATIVVGRSAGWDDEKIKALHGLNSRLSGIRVITYDYLLAQGGSLVSYLSSTAEKEDEGEVPF
jgi:hypothetical protein